MIERDRQGSTDGRRQIGSVNAAKTGFRRKRRDAAGAHLALLEPKQRLAGAARHHVLLA